MPDASNTLSPDLTGIPILATLREVAAFLRLSPRKVFAMGKSGAIRIVRIDRSVRYYLREYIEVRQMGHEQA